jgi:CubicO group peptidase (beta-lactamase class C family)
MRSLVLAALAFVAAVFATPALAADDREAAIRATVEDLRTKASVPAIGLGVIDRGEVVFLGGLGEVDGRPATERDAFRAASISKLFAAQTAMRLVEQRRLDLDDDVGRWLPAFAGRGLTVRHLLTHRSGFRDAIFALDSDDPSRVEAYLALLAKQPPTARPGTAYAYTDADFNVLGAVVAAAGGRPYVEVVQSTILAPLKLGDSSAFPARAARAHVAQPFMNKPTVRPAVPRPYDLAFAPSEGLVTSARDLTAWTRATMRKDRRLLKAASFEAMLVPQADAGGPGRSIGLAWQLREEGDRRVAEHAGSVRGYNALVVTYPAEQRAIVILTNADDAPRWEIARAVDRILGPRR